MAAALGAAGLPPRRRLRVSLLMTSFEAGMPLVGLALGAPLGRAIGSAADYIAVGLLLIFGFYVLALRHEADEEQRVARLGEVRGWPAVALGMSISLDELTVGFTLGLLRLPIYAVIILVAAQAFIVSQLGLRVSAKLNERVREGAERVAGLALVGLGIGLLAAKLL